MRTSPIGFSRWGIAVLLCLSVAPVCTVHAQESVRPCLLLLSAKPQTGPMGQPSKYRLRAFLPDLAMQKNLRQWGYEWTPDFLSTQLSVEYLRQFNAVVMYDFPKIERYPDLKEDVRRAEQCLMTYVREGGGLLLTGSIESSQWGMERNMEELNRFIAPLGAQVALEQVHEDNPVLILPKQHRNSVSRLAWAGNVTAHPVTQGVRGLLYPSDYGSMCYFTHPVTLHDEDAWTALVQASQTAHGVTAPLGTDAARTETAPGSVKTSPVLIAARNVGKGRVVLWPTIPTAYLIDGYHSYWGSGLTMAGGDSDHPSDGEALVKNALAWLSAPSQGTSGGFSPGEPEEVEEPGLRRIDWSQLKLPAQDMPGVYKGLIGLRSSLSDGAARPAQLIEQGKRAGYRFVAFAESLSQLTEPELTELSLTCRAASSAEFNAFPGFTYLDESRNTWLVFGDQIQWPKPQWWRDRKAGMLRNNNTVFRGFQFQPVIMVNPNENPESPCLQGNFKGYALFTYDSGRLVGDALDTYVELQRNDFKLFPVVIHMVRTPQEITAASAPDLPQTYVPWYEPGDVLSAFRGTSPMYKGRHVFRWPHYVSNGPSIHSFRVINFGISDLQIPGNNRYRMHVNVSSPVGLESLTVLDGGHIWRRVNLTGNTEFECTFDGFHDRNHHFMLDVRDRAGGVAYSADRGTGVQELNVPRCTDNLNTFHSGKFTAQAVFPIRGLENYIGRQALNLNAFPKPMGIKQFSRPAVDQQLTLVSRFGFVKTDSVRGYYPSTATSNWNKTDVPEQAVEGGNLCGSVTQTVFTPWADGPAIALVAGEFGISEELRPRDGEIALYSSLWLKDSPAYTAVYRNRPARTVVLNDRRRSWSETCDDLLYVSNIGAESGARAIVPLETPGNYRFHALRGGSAEEPTYTLRYRKIADGKVLQKDSRLTFSYLAIWSEANDCSDNSFAADVTQKLGLAREPAYRATPRQGEILSTKGILRMRAQDHAFAGTFTQADLPLHLPVLISGLNPRWPAGIWYRGEHRFTDPVWTMDEMGNRFAARTTHTETDRLSRFGIANGVGLLQIDVTEGGRDVFIGNLIVCDNPEIVLELEGIDPEKPCIMINNPTDRGQTATVTPNAHFNLIRPFRKHLSLAPGALVRFAPEQ